MYLARSFGKAGKLTVGQFKQYFSLDDRTSSNYGTFLERGNAGTTLAPLYRLGASWQSTPATSPGQPASTAWRASTPGR